MLITKTARESADAGRRFNGALSFMPRDTDSSLDNSEKWAFTWMDVLRKLVLSDDRVAARLSAAT